MRVLFTILADRDQWPSTGLKDAFCQKNQGSEELRIFNFVAVNLIGFMNKNFPLVLLASVAITRLNMAQITVERSDLGDLTATTLILANDTVNLSVISPGNPGPNQTWNLSMMANHYQDTMAFIPPAGTPCAADFPQATFAISMGDGFGYGYDDNTKVEIQGYCGNAGPFSANITVKIVPPERVMIFPLTFGTIWDEQNRQVLTVANPNPPPDSVRIVSTTQRNYHVDGWGVVTTPAGSFNALRIKGIRDQIDSVFVKMFGLWAFFQREESHQIEYSWIPKGGLWVASVVVDNTSGQVIQAQYVVNPTASLKETSENDLVFFPNPVHEGIATLVRRDDMPAVLTLLDVNGRMVKTEPVNSATYLVDFGDLAPGIYTARLTDKISGKTSLTKLVLAD